MEPTERDGRAYCRMPTIHGDRVVFVAEGNLWSVGVDGGVAHRLTSSTATHTFPHFSPDGRWIAFSSEDEGPAAVWVMPAGGGEARRLTFHGTPDQVAGWTLDGSEVVFRTFATEGVRAQTLASVPLDGGAVTALPYGRGTKIAYHPDGDRVAVHRHSGDPAWWKRYSGGRAGRIWLGRHSDGAFTRVEGGPRTDACPMWIGDSLYFLSDHEGMGDIWCCDAAGANRRRVTSHGTYFARWPQADGTRIVYSMGARIYLLDVADADPQPREIDVEVRGHSLSSRRKIVDVPRSMSAYATNADATQTLLTVRGRIARLANWHGPARVLADPDGVRFRNAQWLGATDRLVAIADHDGEDQVVLLPDEGIGGDVSGLTSLGGVGVRIRSVLPSPDGKRVAVLDHGRSVYVIDVESGEHTLVDDQSNLWVRTASWSPCSTWLAYARSRSWWDTKLYLWGLTQSEPVRIGSREFNDFAPAWDPAGRYLAFLSTRHLDPYYSQFEHEFTFPAATRAYVVTLREDEPVPFAPETAPPAEEPKRVEEPIAIDLDGIARRVCALPFDAGRYEQIGCSTTGVAVLRTPLEGSRTAESHGEDPAHTRHSVLGYSFSERKVKTLLEATTGWVESADGSKWLHRIGPRFRVIPAAAKRDEPPGNGADAHASPKSGWVDVDRVTITVEPRAEFRQMFHEAWRLQRDHFYDEQLVGVDWEACRDRYEPLIDCVRTREEMIDLLWELQGELGTSHAYAMGGDLAGARRYRAGLLGCDFELDGDAYRITRIYAGDPWAEDRHSPLAAPGKRVSEGDYLLSVDGHPVGGTNHPGSLLLGRSGQQVVLDVASDAAGADRRQVTVTPIDDDRYLRYRDWVDACGRRVEEASGGRLGYIHIPDMGLPGAVEFHRHFPWQVDDREGFVVDVRYNGGGNISGILLRKLTRKIVGWEKPRWGRPFTYPFHAPRGPTVVLTNENAGSDGDIFSQAVKAVGLGPLIGMRTWGGVVGIDHAKDLVDRGVTTQPEYAFWFDEVRWGVENHGVDPDIVVDRTPADAVRGEDPQLERAIAEAMERLESAPKLPPDLGPLPDLGFDAS